MVPAFGMDVSENTARLADSRLPGGRKKQMAGGHGSCPAWHDIRSDDPARVLRQR